MAATQRSKRRQVPVKLTDVPLDVRLKHAHAEARRARSDHERAELIAAALVPSDTVFYITDDDEQLRAA